MRKIKTAFSLIFAGILLLILGFIIEKPKTNDVFNKNLNYKNISDFDNLVIEDFVGNVTIIAANENKIIYDDKTNFNLNHNTLKIKTINNQHFVNNKYCFVKIYYKDLDNIFIKDSFGNLNINLKKVPNLEIEDFAGKALIKTNDNYKLEKNSSLTSIKSENYSFSNDFTSNISINNSVIRLKVKKLENK